MKNLVIKLLLPAILLSSLSFSHAQDNEEWGIASYYSDSFQGRMTSYGEAYDKDKLTAAHKIHPYGTMLKVTRLDNKKSVTVKVTDKGPYIKGRVVDLSRAAAERIGLVEVGLAEVSVEVVGRSRSKPETAKSTQPKAKVPTSYDEPQPRRIVDAETPSSTKATETSTTKNTSSEPTSKSKATASTATKKTTASEKSSSSSSTPRLVGKEYEKYGVYKISIQKPEEGNYGVQVASLVNYENVFRQVADLQARSFDDILVSIEEGKVTPVYKIILGPFASEAAAENYRKNLASRYKIKGFVTTLKEETEDK
jgi:rare lipoprotein A